MKKKSFWITLSLANLCIVALLGVTLRTKYLFPLPSIDYKNFLSAHSHFAFGGWVTLILMVLFIDTLLNAEQQQKKVYRFILWGIEISSVGMVISFPFRGYAFFSILFSTLFIFFTYAFSWFFIKDLRKTKIERSIRLLGISALASLVISSIGPFTLAYFLATKSGDAILFRDALYFYLHFQYNGFFVLAVFALLLHGKPDTGQAGLKKRRWYFSLLMCLSILPTLFLSLLWHSDNIYIRAMAFLGCSLILAALASFASLLRAMKKNLVYRIPIARTLMVFSLVSFFIKMLLQTGTIIPSLGNAVFGYRPVIIGFLHLVFLGFVTFYILSHLSESGDYPAHKKGAKLSLVFFSAAIILNETILLADGIGLMLNSSNPVYGWLLWIAAILLFAGAILILLAKISKEEG